MAEEQQNTEQQQQPQAEPGFLPLLFNVAVHLSDLVFAVLS